jgi:hypothetical protein
LVPLKVLFGEEPRNRWKLQPHPEATEEQVERRVQWLGKAGAQNQEAQTEKSPESPSKATDGTSGRR